MNLNSNNSKGNFIRMKRKLWYIFCFLILALIDWRRGSADGVTQLTFSYLTGAVVALMMLPEVIKIWKADLKNIIGLVMAAVFGGAFLVFGSSLLEYKGERVTAAISLGISLYFIFVYVSCKGVKSFFIGLKSTWYILVITLILLQIVSRNDSLICLYYFICFGSFALYFREVSDKEEFFMILLYGFVVWFFIQQAFAFGFRPYDRDDYRGMYFGITQNSMHYLMAFTACLLLSCFNRKKKFLGWFFFIVAGCLVCFTLLTARKTALLAEVSAAIVVLLCGYYKEKKWILRAFGKGFVLLGITIAMFVPVYAGARYLPTILHHPLYFYGEYSEEISVRSFDAWDSDRYVTFEDVFIHTAERYLSMLGIEIMPSSVEPEDVSMGEDIYDTKGILTESSDRYADSTMHSAVTIDTLMSKLGEKVAVYAAESEKNNEIALNEESFIKNRLTCMTEYEGVIYVWLDHYITSDSVRETIYEYYLENLNLTGHTKAEGTFTYVYEPAEIPDGIVFTDMHNMFLEILYRDGIPAGLIFLGLYAWMLVRGFRRAHSDKIELIRLGFLIALMIMGSFENVLNVGFMCMTMILLMFATMDTSKIRGDKCP